MMTLHSGDEFEEEITEPTIPIIPEEELPSLKDSEEKWKREYRKLRERIDKKYARIR